jgi:hypothetical protein
MPAAGIPETAVMSSDATSWIATDHPNWMPAVVTLGVSLTTSCQV